MQNEFCTSHYINMVKHLTSFIVLIFMGNSLKLRYYFLGYCNVYNKNLVWHRTVSDTLFDRLASHQRRMCRMTNGGMQYNNSNESKSLSNCCVLAKNDTELSCTLLYKSFVHVTKIWIIWHMFLMVQFLLTILHFLFFSYYSNYNKNINKQLLY